MASTVESFPNLGVSLAFLKSIRSDPRLHERMCDLPVVTIGKDGVPYLREPPRDEIDSFELTELREFGHRYRVFSSMEGDQEFGRYSGEVHVTKDEWIRHLRDTPSTTTQINEVIVKVDTFITKLSYCEMLKSNARLIGKPTVFLSHAWRYDFCTLIDAVLNHFGTDSPDVFLWNDIFSENQVQAHSKPKDYFFVAFREAIKSIGTTLLVLGPWDRPIPFTRSWYVYFATGRLDNEVSSPHSLFHDVRRDVVSSCLSLPRCGLCFVELTVRHTLVDSSVWNKHTNSFRCVWELYCTISTGATLLVELLPKSRDRFRKVLENDFDKISQRMCEIDAAQASALCADTKSRIDRTIRDSVGFVEVYVLRDFHRSTRTSTCHVHIMSTHRVSYIRNKIIGERMREWLARSAREIIELELDNRRVSAQKNDTEAGELITNTAQLFRELGKVINALSSLTNECFGTSFNSKYIHIRRT